MNGVCDCQCVWITAVSRDQRLYISPCVSWIKQLYLSPCDAYATRAYRSIYHTLLLYQSAEQITRVFRTEAILCVSYIVLVGKSVITKKVRLLFCRTLSKTLNLQDSSAVSPQHVDRRECCQLCAIVTSLSLSNRFCLQHMPMTQSIVQSVCDSGDLLLPARLSVAEGD